MQSPGILATLVLRSQMHCHERGRVRTGNLLRTLGLFLVGADFVPGCSAGPGLLMHHPAGIVFGRGARIGCNATILQRVTLGEAHTDYRSDGRYPSLGDNVTVGAGASILGDVTVGDGAVVGAHSLLLSDVPKGCTAVGVPHESSHKRVADETRQQQARNSDEPQPG